MGHAHTHHDKPFPRGVLFGAAALIGVTLLLAGMARFADVGTTRQAPPVPAQSVDLRFDDRPDGSLVVTEAGTGRTIDVLASGSGGFVRGVMRGLARERMLHRVGPDVPFRLVLGTDGRLTIEDPQTRQAIDLHAFGPTNAQAFARFLETGAGAR